MGKLAIYLLVMSGLMLLFYFGGLISSTPNSALLNLLLDPESMQTLPLALKVIMVLQGIGVAAGAIFIGYVTHGKVDLIVLAPFTVYLFNLGWDFLVVYQNVAAVNKVMGILLFSPLFLLYMFTILEWWRGRD